MISEDKHRTWDISLRVITIILSIIAAGITYDKFVKESHHAKMELNESKCDEYTREVRNSIFKIMGSVRILRNIDVSNPEWQIAKINFFNNIDFVEVEIKDTTLFKEKLIDLDTSNEDSSEFRENYLEFKVAGIEFLNVLKNYCSQNFCPPKKG